MSPRKASIGGRWNNLTDCAHHGCSCCSAVHCWFLASFASSDCPVQPFLSLSHGGTRGFWPGECSSTLQLKPEAMPKINQNKGRYRILLGHCSCAHVINQQDRCQNHPESSTRNLWVCRIHFKKPSKNPPHVEFRSDWTPLLGINGHRLGFLVIP
jgi:hypothetical protein